MAEVEVRIKHSGWNAFQNDEKDPLDFRRTGEYGGSYTYGGRRPERANLYFSREQSIIASIFVRLGMDVSSIDIRHARVNKDDQYLEDIDSGLNECLKLDPNIDQAAQAFVQDIAMTLFDKGVAAIVPVDTTLNPDMTGGWDVKSMRVGEVTMWYPRHVRVSIYNEASGTREEITLPKKMVAIVENPLHAVMNEPNSTLQRLIRKLNMLDSVDEQSASGKLDLIMQVPYQIKSPARQEHAEKRRLQMEAQLKDSKYGIAWADSTEKITQLNRPVENNLMAQVEYLTTMLYAQLGLTEEVMNGTADEATMLNYENRTIKPILKAITQEMRRKFLTKTARSQGQSILYFLDAFKLVPLSMIADIADKFTRAEAATSNEIRAWVGMRPHSDPTADELRNTNMPVDDTGVPGGADPGDLDSINAELDDAEGQLDKALAED